MDRDPSHSEQCHLCTKNQKKVMMNPAGKKILFSKIELRPWRSKIGRPVDGARFSKIDFFPAE